MKMPMNRREFCFSMTGLGALAAAPPVPIPRAESRTGDANAGVEGAAVEKYDIPGSWRRAGLVLQRGFEGPGSSVIGDPCIVRDDDIDGWRMFLFFDPPGCGQAVCPQGLDAGPGHWKMEGPLGFTNPEKLSGGYTHKPYVVMDAHHPNRAARIDGRYCLLTVSWDAGHKVVQRSWAGKLSGPWTVQPEPLIHRGEGSDFDAKHADAVTGFYFPERGEILYFYMGYPAHPQSRAVSPLGSAQGGAVQRADGNQIRKLGEILPPCQTPGHWASGWVGGLQILPGKTHRWIAVINASPTAPRREATEVFREEPPPSLGGFAFCDEDWPVRGWKWMPHPIEWIINIPPQAAALGEGVNLWRQHVLGLPGGGMALFYNSGFYGKEQLFMKVAGK
jgi:hypothetical protein